MILPFLFIFPFLRNVIIEFFSNNSLNSTTKNKCLKIVNFFLNIEYNIYKQVWFNHCQNSQLRVMYYFWLIGILTLLIASSVSFISI